MQNNVIKLEISPLGFKVQNISSRFMLDNKMFCKASKNSTHWATSA